MILFDLWVNRSLSKNECFELIESSMGTGRYDMIRLLALGRQQMATALFVSNIFYSRGHDIMTYPYVYNNRYGVQLYISTRKSILYHRVKSNVDIQVYIDELNAFEGSMYVLSGCGLACVNALEIMTRISFHGWQCVHTSYGNASQYKEDDISLKTTIRLEFIRSPPPHDNPDATVLPLNNENEFPPVNSNTQIE